VLQAKSFGLTGIGIGAIVTRFATYAVPTIRLTNRKVAFAEDKELIDQQFKLVQAGKGGVDIDPNKTGLTSVASKYNNLLSKYGFGLSSMD